MQTDLPIYDGPEEAIGAAVAVLGGKKAVALMLWPQRAADAGAQKLRDQLDPQRSEKLDYHEVIAILRAARDAGYYAPFQWFAAQCGFDAAPVTKAEELDRAMAAVENASKALKAGLATLERMQLAGTVA